MKKNAKLVKRIVAMALSVVMVISLFPTNALQAFAEEIAESATPVLDFVPADGEAVAEQMDYDVVYIRNNELTVYEHYTYGVAGETYTGAQGEQIELSDSYTYTDGEEQIVIYRYYALEDAVMKTAQLAGYGYISADDVSFEAVEKPTATPTPDDSSSSEDTSSSEETSSGDSAEDSSSSEDASSSEDTSSSEEDGIKLDFIPEDGIADNTTPTEKYAVITTETIRLYKDLDYGAEGIEMTVSAGTVIEVVTAYTFSNGQVLYRFDYNGAENSALYNAALSQLSGYQFIPAEYITLGVETVADTTITDPDTSVSVTGVLPTTAELDTVPTATEELPEAADTTDISADALIYDFTLANGGAHFEPSGTVKVTFPQQNITFAQGTEYTIYHITDDGVVTELGTATYDGGDINVDVDTFSYIALSAEEQDTDSIYTEIIDPVTGVGVTNLPSGHDYELTVEEVTTPPSGTEEYLIWGTSQFYNVTLTQDGEPFYDEYGVDVIFPRDEDMTIGDYFYSYRLADGLVEESLQLTDYGNYASLTQTEVTVVPFDDLGIIGVSALYDLKEATDVDLTVVSKDTTLRLYDINYLDMSFYVDVPVTQEDTFKVIKKYTVTDGITTIEAYEIDPESYTGSNEELMTALYDIFACVRVEDVEEYVEEESEIVYGDVTYTDEITGITVSGTLPQGTIIDVKESTLEASGLDTTKYPVGENTMVYDVSMTYNGKDYMPEDDYKIKIPANKVVFNSASAYMIYQIGESSVVSTRGPIVYSSGFISLPFTDTGSIIYTDTFATASNKDFNGGFTDNNVTFYEAPFESATTHEITNALDRFIYVEYSYTDADGVTWHKFYNEFSDIDSEYLFVKTDKVKKIFTNESYGITIAGSLPADVEVNIASVDNVEDILDTTKYTLGNDTVAYDISLALDGEEYQPTSAVDVTFPASLFSAASGTDYTGYHIHDGEVEELGTYTYTGEDIVVTVDNFSYIALIETVAAADLGTPTTETPVSYPENVKYNAVFADEEVVLYSGCKDTVDTATITGATGEKITLTAYIDYADGTRLYAYSYAGADADIADTSANYQYISAEDVTYSGAVFTDTATGVQVNAQTPLGSVLTVKDWTLTAGVDNGLIWNNALFYEMEITSDGETVVPETAEITFSADKLPFAEGDTYSFYTINEDGKAEFEYGCIVYEEQAVTTTWDGKSVIGVARDLSYASGDLEFASDAEEGFEGFTGTFANIEVNLHASFSLLEYESFTTAETDVFYVYDKVTITYGEGQTVDVYLIDTYAGENDAMAEAISPTDDVYPCEIVLCSDVKEFVPPEPVYSDMVLKDPATGVTVSGVLPQGVKLNVTPITDISDIDLGSYPIGENFVAYDITLTYYDREIQPNGEVYLEIPEAQIPFSFASGYVVYHVHDEGVEVRGPIVYTKGFIRLPFTSFSQFIYTDVYVEASNVPFETGFNSNSVTFYTSPFADATEYPVINAYDRFVDVEFSYTEADGTVWHKFCNEFPDITEPEYLYVKGTDIKKLPKSTTNIVQTTPQLNSENTVSLYNMNSLTLNAKNMQLFNAEPEDTDNNGLVINKTVSDPVDGVYTITLEAYVTGNVTVTRSSIPTDIILVLDQSGSMKSAIGTEGYYGISGITWEIVEEYDNIYVKVGEEYKSVTVRGSGSADVYAYTQLYTENSGGGGGNDRGKNKWFYDDDRIGNIWYNDGTGWYQVEISRTNGNPRVYTYTYEKNGTTYYVGGGDGKSSGSDTRPEWATQLFQRNTREVYSTYTFSYEDADGNTVTKTYTYDQDISSEGYFYYGEDTRSRTTVLKEAVQSFVEGVRLDALGKDGTLDTEDDINHRIAVVGFSNCSNYDNYTGSEVFIGENSYNYNTTASSQYGNAMQDMDTATGIANIRATVGYDANSDGDYNDSGETNGALAEYGATYVDLGIEMANGILAEEAKDTVYEQNGNTVRNKVVIVFTDGAPGYSGSWGNGTYDSSRYANAGAVAVEALKEAQITKNTHKATVYTIGIFGGADYDDFTIDEDNKSVELDYLDYSATAGDSGDDAIANANRYMHYMSSNYTPDEDHTPTMTAPGDETFPRDDDGMPTGDSYYLSAGDSEALNSIFQKLSENISGTSNSQLTEETVVKDIISPYFKLPARATTSNIIVTTSKASYDESTKEFKWTNEGALANAGIEIGGEENKTINVTGFNFKENYVATTARKETETSATADFCGRKLVITFPVVVEPDFLGGNNVPTNGDLSGVYANADATDAVEKFEVPTKDVALKTINPVLENQYIYLTNIADLDTMIAGSSDTDSYKYEYTLDGTTYNFDGENNGYVDVTYTVYEKNADGTYTAVKTLTINAGQNVGSWSTTDTLLSGLTEDKTYYISCKITPTTEGTAKETESSKDPGTIYVFKPVVTFKDSTGWLGDNVPALNDANNVATTQWKHAALGTAPASMGTAPTITNTYAPGTGVEEGVIVTTADIPVTVTSAVNETDITANTTYLHQDCDAGEDLKGGQLLIHVNTVSLDISKEVTGSTNISGEFTVTVAFEGNTFSEDLTILRDGTDATLSVADGKATVTLELVHEQTITLEGLPIGKYTATETVDPDRYDTTVNGKDGTTDYVTLSSDNTVDAIAFVNELRTGSLTITKVVADGTASAGEAFVFTVKNDATGYTQKVVIAGEGSITINNLPIGVYEVTEDMDWAYKYTTTPATVPVTITETEDGTATITNTPKTDKWLKADAYAENVFDAVTTN